jgi:hypothetical protein
MIISPVVDRGDSYDDALVTSAPTSHNHVIRGGRRTPGNARNHFSAAVFLTSGTS